MRRVLALAAAVSVALVIAACQSGGPGSGAVSSSASTAQNPLGANAACYVCHMTFVREELTTTHLRQEMSCAYCHGPSEAHANDEDIGASPPDRAFARAQVADFCRECHKRHDVKPERVIARWHERVASGFAAPGREPAAVCTDCHGMHRIHQSTIAGSPDAGPSQRG